MGRIKMAELYKKLYIKNTEGVTQSAKLYSTTSESQTPYLSLKVDNINCYASLTDVSDSRATSGRIKKSDGTILAIGESGVSPYGYSLFTTSGSFTVPSGVTKLRVTCIGGGAGGGTGRSAVRILIRRGYRRRGGSIAAGMGNSVTAERVHFSVDIQRAVNDILAILIIIAVPHKGLPAGGRVRNPGNLKPVHPIFPAHALIANALGLAAGIHKHTVAHIYTHMAGLL